MDVQDIINRLRKADSIAEGMEIAQEFVDSLAGSGSHGYAAGGLQLINMTNPYIVQVHQRMAGDEDITDPARVGWIRIALSFISADALDVLVECNGFMGDQMIMLETVMALGYVMAVRDLKEKTGDLTDSVRHCIELADEDTEEYADFLDGHPGLDNRDEQESVASRQSSVTLARMFLRNLDEFIAGKV